MTDEPVDHQRPDAFSTSTVFGGRYSLLRRLGQGASGEVYLAADLELPGSPHVALKILSHSHLGSHTIDRFKREVLLLRKLSHENIVQVFEFAGHTTAGSPDVQYFFVMEYVAGSTVRQLLNDHPLPFERVLTLFKQLLEALKHAHSKGVLHRDLKPENLLVAPGGTLKLADFGVAGTYGSFSNTSQAVLTADNDILGTPAYLAPELLQGEAADPRSDLYSAALICYELLIGKPLFTGSNPYEVFQRKLNTKIPSLKRADVPPWFSDLLCAAMQSDREKRTHSAELLLDEIQRHQTSKPIPQLEQIRKKLTRGVIWGLAVLGCFCAGVVALAHFHIGTQLYLYTILLSAEARLGHTLPQQRRWINFQADELDRFLLEAVIRSRHSAAALLLDAGANPRGSPHSSLYPIEEAIKANDARMLQLLLDNKATLLLPGNSSAWKDLFAASPELLEIALRHETPPLQLPGEHFGLLIFGTLLGTEEHLRILLASPAVSFDQGSAQGYPLVSAVEELSTKRSQRTMTNLRLLLNSRYTQYSDWPAHLEYALNLAAHKHMWDTIDLLLSYEGEKKQQHIILMKAALDDNRPELLKKLLLQHGAISDGEIAMRLFTHVLIRKNMDMARLIISESDSPNIRDERGISFIYYAMLHNNTDLVRFLINYPGFDLAQVDPDSGKGPLDWALTSGRYDVVGVLLDSAVPPHPQVNEPPTYLEIVRYAPYEIVHKYLNRQGEALTDWKRPENSTLRVALLNPDLRVFERVLIDPELQGCPELDSKALLAFIIEEKNLKEAAELYRALAAIE